MPSSAPQVFSAADARVITGMSRVMAPLIGVPNRLAMIGRAEAIGIETSAAPESSDAAAVTVESTSLNRRA